MRTDIDEALRSWEYQPGNIQARMVEGSDGRQVIQMRIDLGILQLEKLGRPDGTRPHGFITYFDYLKYRARNARESGEPYVMTEAECHEADREFVQFYHRRICWLALQNYARAIADADHTLAFMDFVRQYSPDPEYTIAHERYRGFVLFQRTQAMAALMMERDDPEAAIDEIREGIQKLDECLHEYDQEVDVSYNPMMQHLRRIEQSIRDEHGITSTLQEKLAEAVANEKYEEAARLRDALRSRK